MKTKTYYQEKAYTFELLVTYAKKMQVAGIYVQFIYYNSNLNKNRHANFH